MRTVAGAHSSELSALHYVGWVGEVSVVDFAVGNGIRYCYEQLPQHLIQEHLHPRERDSARSSGSCLAHYSQLEIRSNTLHYPVRSHCRCLRYCHSCAAYDRMSGAGAVRMSFGFDCSPGVHDWERHLQVSEDR